MPRLSQREINEAVNDAMVEIGVCSADMIRAAYGRDYAALKLAVHQAHGEIDALFTNIGWSDDDEKEAE